MTKTPVRKFSDLITGEAKPAPKSKVAKAFADIRNTPQGRVIEQYFLNLMTITPPPEAPDSAFRENAVERRLAARIVRMMNEAEPGDGPEPAATATGRRRPGARRS